MDIGFNNVLWTITFTDPSDDNCEYPFMLSYKDLKIRIPASGNEQVVWINLVNAVSRAVAFSHSVDIYCEDAAFDFISKYLDDIMSASYFIYTETFKKEPHVFAK